MSTGRILVVDVGTSSVRAGIVRDDASVSDVVQIPIQASSPEPGQVEFDARAIQAAVLETSRAALATGAVDGVGIANQRATTVVWDARTGLPRPSGCSTRTTLTAAEASTYGLARWTPGSPGRSLRVPFM